MKIVKLMCLSLLFAACINGGIIENDMDDSKIVTSEVAVEVNGYAFKYEDKKGDDNEGITVTLKRTDMASASQTAKTNKKGVYSFSDVPVGTYEVSATGKVDNVEKQSGTAKVEVTKDGDVEKDNVDLYLVSAIGISYDKNGGDGECEVVDRNNVNGVFSIADGSGLSLTTSGKKYVFESWNTKRDGTGETVQPGSDYTPKQSITLYAQYSNKCTVTYNANGAEKGEAPKGESVEIGESVTIADGSGLSRTNYTFLVWNTQANGGGISYNPGDKPKPPSSLSLFAQWQGKAYKVTFDTNKGSGSIDFAEKSVRYDETYGELPDMYMPEFYKFLGWFTASDGGTQINDTSKVTTAKDHTLYAHWELTLGSGTITVTLEGAPQDQNIILNGTQDIDWSAGGTLNVTVNTAAGQWANKASFAWYLDGAPISGETASQRIKAQDCALGTHILSVLVSKNGASYSKSVVFKIVE